MVATGQQARVLPHPSTPEKALVARPSREEAETAVRTLIAWAGDDPSREGLVETPGRVVQAYAELFAGYLQDPSVFLERTFEEVEGYGDLVLVRAIPFTSHCEHHMLPIRGHAHIAYYPGGEVVGLSKLARVVDAFALRLQTQERLTAQIIQAIETTLKPVGAGVMLEAEHSCMAIRGVKKSGASTLTMQFSGSMKDPAEQARFVSLVRAGT